MSAVPAAAATCSQLSTARHLLYLSSANAAARSQGGLIVTSVGTSYFQHFTKEPRLSFSDEPEPPLEHINKIWQEGRRKNSMETNQPHSKIVRFLEEKSCESVAPSVTLFCKSVKVSFSNIRRYINDVCKAVKENLIKFGALTEQGFVV